MASRKIHSQVQIAIYSEQSIAVPFLKCQKIMVRQNESLLKALSYLKARMVGSKAMMKKEFTDWLTQAAVQVAAKMISFYLC